MNRILKAAVMAALLILAYVNANAQAQNGKESNMVILGHGWYGIDIEQTRPNLKTPGYMTYEAAVGFQTDPSKGNLYDQAFGFPMISVGFSLASMGDFQFYDHTRFPNLYSLYGSFERSLKIGRAHV